MAIVTREGKGDLLTHEELDGNFTYLDGKISSEETARTTNETTLQSEIDSVDNRVTTLETQPNYTPPTDQGADKYLSGDGTYKIVESGNTELDSNAILTAIETVNIIDDGEDVSYDWFSPEIIAAGGIAIVEASCFYTPNSLSFNHSNDEFNLDSYRESVEQNILDSFGLVLVEISSFEQVIIKSDYFISMKGIMIDPNNNVTYENFIFKVDMYSFTVMDIFKIPHTDSSKYTIKMFKYKFDLSGDPSNDTDFLFITVTSSNGKATLYSTDETDEIFEVQELINDPALQTIDAYVCEEFVAVTMPFYDDSQTNNLGKVVFYPITYTLDPDIGIYKSSIGSNTTIIPNTTNTNEFFGKDIQVIKENNKVGIVILSGKNLYYYNLETNTLEQSIECQQDLYWHVEEQLSETISPILKVIGKYIFVRTDNFKISIYTFENGDLNFTGNSIETSNDLQYYFEQYEYDTYNDTCILNCLTFEDNINNVKDYSFKIYYDGVDKFSSTLKNTLTSIKNNITNLSNSMGTSLTLTSPNGTEFKIIVDDAGNLETLQL